jgi:hypothetical protein
VNEWVDEAATTYQGSIPLNAQQLYNIELEYFYQNDNGAQVSLAWSSPSTPQTVIPESQLYPYTNPPPTVVLASPTNGSSYTAAASVTIGAMADAPNNPISTVAFYTNGVFLAALSNSLYAPLYEVTVTGLGAGSYALTAVATDGSGLGSTSAPVNITVAAGLLQHARDHPRHPPRLAAAPALADRCVQQHPGHDPGRRIDLL